MVTSNEALNELPRFQIIQVNDKWHLIKVCSWRGDADDLMSKHDTEEEAIREMRLWL